MWSRMKILPNYVKLSMSSALNNVKCIILRTQGGISCVRVGMEEAENKQNHLIRWQTFQMAHSFDSIWCQNYVSCFIHTLWISKLEWPNRIYTSLQCNAMTISLLTLNLYTYYSILPEFLNVMFSMSCDPTNFFWLCTKSQDLYVQTKNIGILIACTSF